MPHNLYLHSSICKDRRMVVGETKRERSSTADSGAPLSPRGRAGSATSDGNWIELYARSPSSPLANPLRNRSRSPSMTAVTPTSGTIQKEPATLLLIDDPRPVDGASVTSPIHVSVDISGTGRSDITVAADSSRTRASTDADETILTSDKATGYSDKSIRSTIYYASIDCIIALVMAMFGKRKRRKECCGSLSESFHPRQTSFLSYHPVNATILIVAAAAFWQKGIHDVQELQDAYRSLEEYVGQGVGTVFALALLASGQSSTLTGTMAGQVCFLTMSHVP